MFKKIISAVLTVLCLCSCGGFTGGSFTFYIADSSVMSEAAEKVEKRMHTYGFDSCQVDYYENTLTVKLPGLKQDDGTVKALCTKGEVQIRYEGRLVCDNEIESAYYKGDKIYVKLKSEAAERLSEATKSKPGSLEFFADGVSIFEVQTNAHIADGGFSLRMENYDVKLLAAIMDSGALPETLILTNSEIIS